MKNCQLLLSCAFFVSFLKILSPFKIGGYISKDISEPFFEVDIFVWLYLTHSLNPNCVGT